MKTITLWQPWATLIILGFKRYETRSWDTKYRGPIAIHAGKREIPIWEALGSMMDSDPEACLPALMDMLNKAYPDGLPTGCILGTAELKATYPTEDLRKLITPQERALGDYSPDRYAWRLQHIRRLETPIEIAGHQKLWNWEPEGGLRYV